MKIQRLLNNPLGKFIISLLLGLGIASLFRKACKDKNCITFNGPILSEFEGKIYKYNNKCYKYTTSPTTCDSKKKIVDISTHATPEPAGSNGIISLLENNNIIPGASPSSGMFSVFSS